MSDSGHKEYNVGVSAPLTGPVESLGQWTVQGMNIAIQEINDAGGIRGKNTTLIVEDDKCVAAQGVDSVNKLVTIDNVDALVVYCGAVTSAIVPKINETIPIYSISIRTENLEGKYPFLFNIAGSPEQEIQTLSETMKNQDIKKVAVFYQSDFFGQTYHNKFKRYFEEQGGIIAVDSSLSNLANPDFRTDLLKAKEANVDAIFTSFNAAQYAVILKQAKELDMHVRFYSLWNTESKPLIDAAGNLTEGITYTTSFNPKENKAYDIFARKYYDRYHELPEYNAAAGYDTMMIIKNTLNICDTDRECMIRETNKMADFSGVTGSFDFVNQVADREFFIKTIHNHEFIFK